jgi:hypothetical protein
MIVLEVVKEAATIPALVDVILLAILLVQVASRIPILML